MNVIFKKCIPFALPFGLIWLLFGCDPDKLAWDLPVLPIVRTGEISEISRNTFRITGRLADGENFSEKGFSVGFSEKPGPDDQRFRVDSGGVSFSALINNLVPDTLYYIRAYAINETGTGYGKSVPVRSGSGNCPAVQTIIPSGELGSLTWGGRIVDDGGYPILGKGICWAYIGEVPTADQTNSINLGTGKQNFNHSIPGLSIGTYYVVRAWARNRSGICYGLLMDFIPQESLATISTPEVSSIGSTTAVCGGTITSNGGSSIKAKGVCWSTSPNPTIALSTKTINGTGNGSFTSNLTGLRPNTMYYARAYATNSAGTAYGNEVSFVTSEGSGSGLSDIDGNSYTPVTIGSQVWMRENLKTSKYRNGDAIPTNLSNSSWQNTTSGAYAIYDDLAANNTTYGKLYNWYAVADPRGLCPTGWHVPSDAEWTTLENFLEGPTNAGGKMKSTGTIENGSGLWKTPNTNATNISGFSGLPGGSRLEVGAFADINDYGFWWSSTEYSPTTAWFRLLSYVSGSSVRTNFYKQGGFSVRCLKD